MSDSVCLIANWSLSLWTLLYHEILPCIVFVKLFVMYLSILVHLLGKECTECLKRYWACVCVLYGLFNKLKHLSIILFKFPSSERRYAVLKCSGSWSCITSHWVPTFLWKQTWPHFWQTRERTNTDVSVFGRSVICTPARLGTKTNKRGKKAAFHISDVHIWELCYLSKQVDKPGQRTVSSMIKCLSHSSPCHFI